MTLTERWQNVYACFISETFFDKEMCDEMVINLKGKRTHYLKTYWKEDGVICSDPGPELIEIAKS